MFYNQYSFHFIMILYFFIAILVKKYVTKYNKPQLLYIILVLLYYNIEDFALDLII